MKTLLLPILSLIAMAMVKPSQAAIAPHTCTTTYTVKKGDTCYALATSAGWSLSKFEAINPSTNCSNLPIGAKVCTAIKYITTTTTKTTTKKTTTTTKKTTTTTKKSTTTTKKSTTTTTSKKPTTTTTTKKPTTTTTKTTTKTTTTTTTSKKPTTTTTTTTKTATTSAATSAATGCTKTYTVVSGDICSKIAAAANVAESVFESYNPGINCLDLQIGQVVCVAVGAVTKTTTTGTKTTSVTKTTTSAAATGTSTLGCTKTHVITNSDLCYTIYQQYGLTLAQLESYNKGLSCNDLKVGTSLCVAVGPGGGAFPLIPIYSCSVDKTFAITFDDGPYKYTQELVNYLNNNSITATFFINGQNYGNIYDYKDFLIAAYNSGHQIAHHTWSHPNISTLTDAQLTLEITKLEDAFLDILGVIPTYFRPPYGEFTDSSLKILNSLGYKVIVWDVDTDDWQVNKFATEKTNFLNGIAGNTGVPGHISLEHDPLQITVEQLAPWAFDYVKSLGYKPTTVSACIGDDPSNWYRTKSLR